MHALIGYLAAKPQQSVRIKRLRMGQGGCVPGIYIQVRATAGSIVDKGFGLAEILLTVRGISYDVVKVGVLRLLTRPQPLWLGPNPRYHDAGTWWFSFAVVVKGQ